MLVAPAFLLLLVLTSVILGLAVLLIVSKYEQVNVQLRDSLKENLSLKNMNQEKTQKALEKVHLETEAIIKEADKKAEEIIMQADVFKSDEKEAFLNKLKELTNLHTKAFDEINETLNAEYKQSILDEEKKAIEVFQNTTKDIQITADKELAEFKTIMQNETINGQRMADEKIKTTYADLEKELVTYKAEKMQEIDKQVAEKMREIILATLQGSLSPDQQEQLIISAVKEAGQQKNV